MTGSVDGRAVALGNAGLMKDLGIELGSLAAEAEAQRGTGATALFLAIDGKPAGIIAIADPIKADDAGGAGRSSRRQACTS